MSQTTNWPLGSRVSDPTDTFGLTPTEIAKAIPPSQSTGFSGASNNTYKRLSSALSGKTDAERSRTSGPINWLESIPRTK